jgi:acetylornithine deacetylase/succinyl-diaminopimelate desuccinylase-like protein
VNLVLLFEGEEEIGSPSLVPWVRERAGELAADYVLIADSMMFGPGRPSLIFGMRGIAYFEVEAAIGSTDLHSGQYGGAVPNPANALAAVIASMHDAEGRVAIDGFYDEVVPPPESIRSEWRSLGFDDAAFRETAGGAALAGEPGYSTPERLWIRPALDVNGLMGGYTGPGKKTVLPARAVAKLSTRLVPEQDPERIEEGVRRHVERVASQLAVARGVGFEVRALQHNRPWRDDPDAPLFRAAGEALEAVFGTPPVRVAHGGTLPIAPELRDVLGAPVAVMGFALPGANMHAPNEWFPLQHLEKGVRTVTRLYERLAETTRTYGQRPMEGA